MNTSHLRAFLWLRWRLLVNQWRRGGRLNAALMIILSVAAVFLTIPLFVGGIAVGLYAIPKARPGHLLAAWDLIVVAFLFFWSLGLMAELQRSEPLMLSRFLHLPVSVRGAFLINYLSSFLSLSLVVFVPIMLAFCVSLMYVQGLAQGMTLALVAAFLLMITALTYQLQGWLASLMSNPRLRRTILVVTTTGFILLSQLPNLLNFFGTSASKSRPDRATALATELANLEKTSHLPGAETESIERRRSEVLKEMEEAKRATRETVARSTRTARFLNMVLPVGWLPYGAMSAAEGRLLPSLLGFLGMTLIGAASLRQSYRTTLAIYTGEPTNRKGRRASAIQTVARPQAKGRSLLEARLPGFSEPVSAVALAVHRSILRAPEAKMMLLTPAIMLPLFGSMLLNQGKTTPGWARPLIGIGAMLVVLVGMIQLLCNQFGFDRDGFRTFVLSAVPRRDILLGKNLAYAPIAAGMAAILLAILQFVLPLRLDHFLAMFPQFLSMYLVVCILANLLSIHAPVHIPPGTLRPANPDIKTVLAQLVTTMILFPLAEALTLLPLGTELLLDLLGLHSPIPLCLTLTILQCAIVVGVYRLALSWQGRLLQEHEREILEKVAGRAA